MVKEIHQSQETSWQPVARGLGKGSLERVEIDGWRDESWAQYQRDVFRISQLQNKTGFLFPPCSSKPRKSSARPPTRILQHAAGARLWNQPCQGTQLLKTPRACLSKSRTGPWAAHSRGLSGTVTPELVSYGHTESGTQTARLITLLAALCEAGLVSAGLPRALAARRAVPCVSHPATMIRLSGVCSPHGEDRGPRGQQKVSGPCNACSWSWHIATSASSQSHGRIEGRVLRSEPLRSHSGLDPRQGNELEAKMPPITSTLVQSASHPPWGGLFSPPRVS